MYRQNIVRWCQQSFCFQKFVDNTQRCFLHRMQTFLPIIWIFSKGEGDRIESRLPFFKKIYFIASCEFAKKFQRSLIAFPKLQKFNWFWMYANWIKNFWTKINSLGSNTFEIGRKNILLWVLQTFHWFMVYLFRLIYI